MFESVLTEKGNAPRFVGRGAFLSIALHGAALAITLYASARAAKHGIAVNAPTVTFVAAAPPPPPPPPPPAGAKSTPKTSHPKVARTQPLVVPKEVPKEPEPERQEEEEPETSESDSAGATGGVPGGVAGGVAGGVNGGVVGGTVGGTGIAGGVPGGTGVIPFGEGMTRPTLLAGSEPAYTREALVARVQGLMIVKCVITTQGALDACRVVKGLPFMNDAVLAALKTRRYTPVLFQGRAVAVDYVFNIRLVLP